MCQFNAVLCFHVRRKSGFNQELSMEKEWTGQYKGRSERKSSSYGWKEKQKISRGDEGAIILCHEWRRKLEKCLFTFFYCVLVINNNRILKYWSKFLRITFLTCCLYLCYSNIKRKMIVVTGIYYRVCFSWINCWNRIE